MVMSSVEKNQLSWAEAPLAELLRLAWPITVSTLSYSVMTLVDTLLVGRLGPAALSGVGLGGTASLALLCFSFGLLRGAKTLVAQAVGRGAREEIGGLTAAALGFALALGAITVGAGEILARLLPLAAATGASGAAARAYLAVTALGAPIGLAGCALREVSYGEGDSRAPMRAAISANLINAALAWAFVWLAGLGVSGAAMATLIAQAIELAILARARRGWNLRGLEARHLRAVWRIGLPTAIQFALEVGAFATLAAMLAWFGENDMAAHQIALRVIQFSFLPAMAVAEAAAVLAGQAVGARRPELVPKVARLALATAAVYTLACTLVLALAAPLIVSGFTGQAPLAAMAVRLLHVAAVFQVFDGANMVARATLRGTGDVRFPAIVGVITSWALTPPLTWLLGYRLGLGAYGGWVGLTCEIVAGALILWWRLERPCAQREWARAVSLEAEPEAEPTG
jgi:MATE family multidrug resistance protein